MGLGGVAHSGGQEAGARGHWGCIQGDRAGAPPCRTPPRLPAQAHSYPEQDSPVNKLLYAREIPRYKQMVER